MLIIKKIDLDGDFLLKQTFFIDAGTIIKSQPNQ